MKEFILDRVEGEFAIFEDEYGKILEVSISEIKGTFKEGDIFVKRNGNYFVDESLTKERKEYINKQIKNMWE